MKLLSRILDLFFPRRCIFCGQFMTEDGPACKNCERSLPFLKETLCFDGMEPVHRLYCALSYDQQVPEGMAAFKFHGKSHLAAYFADLMMEQMGNQLKLEHCDCVVAVPMHPAKLRKRGYNQAQLLADELSRELELPLDRCLRKIRRSKTQHQLSGRERRKAQKNSYACKPLHGEKVLLVDDICTTGSTLRECARMLRKAGASCVIAATVCKTPYQKGSALVEDEQL